MKQAEDLSKSGVPAILAIFGALLLGLALVGGVTGEWTISISPSQRLGVGLLGVVLLGLAVLVWTLPVLLDKWPHAVSALVIIVAMFFVLICGIVVWLFNTVPDVSPSQIARSTTPTPSITPVPPTLVLPTPVPPTPIPPTPVPPTPIPPTSVPPTPVPTLVPQPSAPRDIGASPEQAIRDYYSAINDRKYTVTWATLSNHFKDIFNPPRKGGYDGYVTWWNSVARVDIGEVRLVKQTGDVATVYAELSYLMKAGNWIYDGQPYIQLILDVTTRTWLFYDKGSRP